MKCPNCKTPTLGGIDLTTGLPARQCSNCNGIWLDANPYLLWRRMLNEDLPRRENVSFDPALDVDKLKLCPSCGRILRRFQVLANTPLYLDRCSHCNGVWMDDGEWQELVACNLHDNLNEFFTASWQNHIRNEELHARMEKTYVEKFGPDDYAHMKEVRAWVQNHPHKGMLLAFLQADDPYQL